ncbi:MAG TPA: IPT/TIG domain-containing protein [Coxiellaceae bacterium]|nr:MAG: hypothetical protein A3E81_04045 [Gammaproteobacteria bacterium RIFCSPHIGHO2_12_FULL_36_30]HLB56074.1 IPT/TIG domain-containing protein [Coxiellaceae bacterium]
MQNIKNIFITLTFILLILCVSSAAFSATKKIPPILPQSGSTSGGDSVKISGANLLNAADVTFGGEHAKILTNTANSITVTTPPNSAGTVDVDITKADGSTITLGTYNYIILPPKIIGISPASGSTAGGDSIIITGTNLSDATRVSFGGASGIITANTANKITVTTPSHNATGNVDVAVTTPGGKAIDTAAFHYLLLPPIISSIFPKSGSITGGNSVTIFGKHLSDPMSVTFDGESVMLTKTNANSITVTAPIHNTVGAVDVAVTTLAGNTTDAAAYTYLIPPPTITNISATSGSTFGGDSIIILGKNLSNATQVTFGGVNAVITNNSRNEITVTIPQHNVGAVNIVVRTKGGSATSAQSFIYIISTPIIKHIFPNTGLTEGGASIKITGKHFSGATSVSFGGINAPSFTVNHNGTTITVITPPHNVGTVDVVVTNSGNTSAINRAAQYTYIIPAPIINAITPFEGATSGGESVTIFGSHLSTTTSVIFGGMNAAFYVVSSTEIVATAPANNAGTVNVQVFTNGGNALSPQSYTYVVQAFSTIRIIDTKHK